MALIHIKKFKLLPLILILIIATFAGCSKADKVSIYKVDDFKSTIKEQNNLVNNLSITHSNVDLFFTYQVNQSIDADSMQKIFNQTKEFIETELLTELHSGEGIEPDYYTILDSDKNVIKFSQVFINFKGSKVNYVYYFSTDDNKWQEIDHKKK